MNAHPRTWSTRRRLGLAVAGIALTTAVGVPTAAYASSPASSPASSQAPAAPAAPKSTCTVGQRWDALAASAPKVAAYLQAHPDLNTELTQLRSEKKAQRRADTKVYFTAHPDEKQALKDARGALTTLHKQCHG